MRCDAGSAMSGGFEGFFEFYRSGGRNHAMVAPHNRVSGTN